MDNRCKDLVMQGDELFGARQNLDSRWQELADNFYVERADFTASMTLGDDFAGNLTTSNPLVNRRDLGNIFSTMLRPSDKDWFSASTTREDELGNEEKRWLEWATKLQKNAIYDPKSGFSKATSAGDDDIAVFGQTVISCEVYKPTQTLLFRDWHLRDVAWMEKPDRSIGPVHRKWSPSAYALKKLKEQSNWDIHPDVLKIAAEKPMTEIRCRHVVVPVEDYHPDTKDGKRWGRGVTHISLQIDVQNQHAMEEVGIKNPYYCIPRWKTLGGSQYAYSPATNAALPDARLIQDMMLVLLESGQKAVDPPLVGTHEAVRSTELYSGGISWIDKDYDERLGDALRPLGLDFSGIGYGLDLMESIKFGIKEAMYLNKVALPQLTKEMTAFEVGQRVAEYVRGALPLFEPLEPEYNGGLMDLTFQVLMGAGGFGPVEDIPEKLLGQEIKFKFENPLREASEKAKQQIFIQNQGLIASTMELDPSVRHIQDNRKALRDAMEGGGTPAEWLRGEDEVEAMAQADNEKAQAAQTLAGMQAGADVAATLSTAAPGLETLQGAL